MHTLNSYGQFNEKKNTRKILVNDIFSEKEEKEKKTTKKNERDKHF